MNKETLDKGGIMEAIYRRFKLIDKEKEKALLQLVEEKRLTPEDLCLILSTISINQTSY